MHVRALWPAYHKRVQKCLERWLAARKAFCQSNKTHLLCKINYPRWRLCFVNLGALTSLMTLFLSLLLACCAVHSSLLLHPCLVGLVVVKLALFRCCILSWMAKQRMRMKKKCRKNILQKWNVLTVWVSARRLPKLLCCRQIRHHTMKLLPLLLQPSLLHAERCIPRFVPWQLTREAVYLDLCNAIIIDYIITFDPRDHIFPFVPVSTRFFPLLWASRLIACLQ